MPSALDAPTAAALSVLIVALSGLSWRKVQRRDLLVVMPWPTMTSSSLTFSGRSSTVQRRRARAVGVATFLSSVREKWPARTQRVMDKITKLFAWGSPELGVILLAVNFNLAHQRALAQLLDRETEFKEYAVDLYLKGKLMQDYLDESAVAPTDETGMLRLRGSHSAGTVLSASALQGISKCPKQFQKNIFEKLSKMIVGSSTGMVPFRGTTSIIPKGASEVLAVAVLSFEALSHIWRWWEGKISNVRCGQQVTTACFSAAGGVFGASAGAGFGAMWGPVGIVAGSMVGGLAASSLTTSLADMLMQKFFCLPKDEAVENAYRLLGVSHRAPPAAVNKSFRMLCLKTHPDQGGNAEDFHKLQVSMELIRIHRGQTP